MNNGGLSILEYTAGSEDNVIYNYMNNPQNDISYPTYTEKTNLALAIAIHQFQGHFLLKRFIFYNKYCFRFLRCYGYFGFVK